jgi:5-methylcytosine-specific restriction endonuclease McrA
VATEQGNRRRPFVRGARATPRRCQHCGREFKPKQADRTTFCGRECAYAHTRAAKLERADRLARERAAALQRQCRVCGAVFAGRTSRATICSAECQKVDGRARFRASWVSARETNPTVTKQCVCCGRGFDTNFRAARRAFCSRACARRHEKSERRYRKRGAFVAPVRRADIIARDHGLCQICGEPVDLTARAPAPRSPSLDHIVPLARGGTHEPGNVQLAHFLCNSLKGDRAPVGLPS